MQPYQEEYIANLKKIAKLSVYKGDENTSFEESLKGIRQRKRQTEEIGKRNVALLREGLLPTLDHIYDADMQDISDLREFAGQLLGGGLELDAGLFCQIHKALLSLARRNRDRNDMIRELYWMGMGYHSLCNRLVGLEREHSRKYTSRMRLCFTEAAAYLKYFDEIEDRETRGYIIRSCANMSLGQFATPSEKIHMVKRTLQILQDKGYREKEPGLPWDRFLYMTHQQMAASMSYGKENTMTAQDVEDVMESVYIVYQRRLQEAEEQKEKPPIRPSYSYCVIQYYCGMYGLGEMLGRIEALMDGADMTDFSDNGMYGIISLPAFYCQFLKNNPQEITKRKEYICSLYQRVFDYMDVFPKASENARLFLYLRQLSYTYVEVEGCIPYKDFLMRLQMRFSPETYVHSRAVAEAAVVFCRILIEEEPGFFDDMDSIREADGEEKKRRILDYAMECGMLHDVGKLNFMELYSQTARQWLDEEYEMAHLHTVVGATWLEERESTKAYAQVALGHHGWYDGSSWSYPESYKRLECPCRQMVDVIGLLDWINNVVDTARLYTGVEKDFHEAMETAIGLEGHRFSPLLTTRLRDSRITGQLEAAFEEGRLKAYHELYRV